MRLRPEIAIEAEDEISRDRFLDGEPDPPSRLRRFVRTYGSGDAIYTTQHAGLGRLMKPFTSRCCSICFKTDVAKELYRILRPGEVLHPYYPNRLHPRDQAEVPDTRESSGHGRAGNTESDYRAMLEPTDFQIDCVVGTGTPAVCYTDRVLPAIRNEFGDWDALPLLPVALPAFTLATFNPQIPFSLYTKAIKPGGAL
jgi:hypothetical protein